jgi:hypothetical protein
MRQFPPLDSQRYETLCAHDSGDTYDQALDRAGDELVNDMAWLAKHGNTQATLVLEAMTDAFIAEAVAELWPGRTVTSLRPVLLAKVKHEVRAMLETSPQRHAWRWN